jgi:ZIP family zinc transporter
VHGHAGVGYELTEGAGFGLALLLTSAAGMATVVGGLFVLFLREPGKRFMATSLGFAAGVMVHVSFVELLPHGAEEIGFGWAHVAFFAGVAGMFLIDALVPHHYMEDHHDHGLLGGVASGSNAGASADAERSRLRRVGLLVALGVGIHNFPEGMATFAAALGSAKLGGAVAIAIAIHNIPEGLAVAAPIYAATGSRGKALLWSLVSGLAEPAGAAVAGAVLISFLSPVVLGTMLCVVAGLMVYISLDELLPASRAYGHEHLSIAGVVLGMAVMALSLGIMG